MPLAPLLPDMDFASALDGSACLGAWAHDVTAGRFHVADALGSALDLAPEEAAGVPLTRVLSGIHADDRLRVESLLAGLQDTGGPFEAEFRTRAGRRGPRWLRLMGRAHPGDAVRVRGLAFDLTEGRLGQGSPTRQVNQLAEHVIAMKGLVPPLGNPSLVSLVDRLAVEIGFELARRLTQPAGDTRH